MPRAPMRPCAWVGCGYLRPCPKHPEQSRAHVLRGTRTQRGYNYSWQEYSKKFLEKHPLCIECHKNGHIRESKVTDHIIPVNHGQKDPNFWKPENHQALCFECHGRKSQSEVRSR